MFKRILFISAVLIFTQLSCMDTLNDAYNTKSDIPRSGLVGEWLFDSNNGSTTYDTSGFGNDGMLAPTGTAPDTSPSEVSGYCGQAYDFDTTTDGIKILGGVANPLNVSYITVSFLIYPTVYGKVIMKDNENATDPGTYQVEINSSNRFVFACFTGSGRVIKDVVSDAIAMNRWYHVACTFDGSMMRIYLDGTLNSESSSGSITILYNDVSNFSTHIGKVPSTGTTSSFLGKIDNVRIYNRALSEDEIKLLADE
jgi:hypothetical protein